MKLRRNFFVSSLIAVAITQAAHAASGSWTGATDGNWHTAGNWTGGVPNAAADTASFNAASSNTTVSIGSTLTTVDRINFSGASTAAYTLTGTGFTNMVMSTNNGGVFIDSGVTTNQDLSGIPIIRPGMDDTINFSNQGSGSLKLGTFQAHNATGSLSTMVFKPGSSGGIEIVTGKVIDNAGTGGSKKISLVLDDVGTLRIAAIGSYDGSNADGNAVSIRQGTLEARVIKNSGTSSSLGAGGRIQFGQASTTNTATLDYYGASDTTNRDFQIIDNNSAVFKVSGSSSTNLTITSAITQSAATNGGGKLTKDGVGILTLDGTSSYTGATLVSAGTLLVNGALGNTAVTVSPSAIIGGSGSIGGNLHFEDGATLTVNLADPLAITGSVTFANFGFSNLVNFDVESVDEGTYTLLAGSGFDLTNVQNVGQENAFVRGDGKLAYFQNGSLQVVVIPEPSAVLLGSLGLLALLRRRR